MPLVGWWREGGSVGVRPCSEMLPWALTAGRGDAGEGGCAAAAGGGFRANILLGGGHPGNFPHKAVEIAPFFFFLSLSGCCAPGTDAAGDGPWGAQLWVRAYGHRKSPPLPAATALRERRETPGHAGCETVRTDFTE